MSVSIPSVCDLAIVYYFMVLFIIYSVTQSLSVWKVNTTDLRFVCDFTDHRNVYVGVHMPHGKKHHHRHHHHGHHHRHRHHKKRHSHSSAESTPNSNDVADNPQRQQSLCQPEDLLAPGTPINPCDRVKFILGEDDTGVGGALTSSTSSNVVGCTSRQLFTEMDELCCYPDHRMEWKETAR